MKLFHQKKGILTPSGKKYHALSNKIVDVYSDEQGTAHELDGTEKPYQEIQQQADEQRKSSEQERQQVVAEMDEKELENEEKMRSNHKLESKHSDLLEAIQTAPQAIVEAVKAIPQTVVPEFPEIPDHIEEQRKWKDEILKALEIEIPEVNLKPVISAIEKIKFPEFPTINDYTGLLVDIKKALPKEVNFGGVIAAIQAIPQVKIPQFEFNNGRLKVEVDRVSLGGNGGNGIATEATLKSIGKFNIPSFDKIEATYPTTTTEVYTYSKESVTVGTITVTYQDSSKAVLLSVVKS